MGRTAPNRALICELTAVTSDMRSAVVCFSMTGTGGERSHHSASATADRLSVPLERSPATTPDNAATTANAIAAKIFLKENVDRRRWTAAVLVCIGVYFLAH